MNRRTLVSGAAALGLYASLAQGAMQVRRQRKAASSLPLDLQSASAAYSTTLLRTAYSGNCLKVRRSSDNATQNIAFSVGQLDTTSLLSFCGAGNGFIDTWYDQSGNGRDMSQTGDTGKQPQIVTSGALTNTIGGHAALKFARVSFKDYELESAVAASNFITTTEGTVFSVFNGTTIDGGPPSTSGNALWSDANNTVGCCTVNDSPTNLGAFGKVSTVAKEAKVNYTAGANAIGVWQHTGGNILCYVNSHTAGATTACGTLDALSAVMWIGDNSTANTLKGYLSTVLFYSASVSAGLLNTIGAYFGTLYGITWS